jgi:nitrate/nitrite transporter NarK
VVLISIAYIGTNAVSYVLVFFLPLIVKGLGVSANYIGVTSALLTGTAAAGGIAMINAVGGLGGWFGPSLFGFVKDMSGSDNIALLCLALAPVMSAILLVVVGQDRRMERIPTRK